MRSIFAVLFLIQIICVLKSDGQAFFIKNSVHPDYPGKCYFEGPPVTSLSIGETKRLPEGCFRISCYSEYSLSVTGCGLQATTRHCRVIPGDVRRPYPHCCSEEIC